MAGEDWDYDRELLKYASCDAEVRTEFLRFKFECYTAGETATDLQHYQCPAGSFQAFAEHNAHWPPLNARSDDLASFD